MGEYCLVLNSDQEISLSHIFTMNIAETYPKGDEFVQVPSDSSSGQVHIYSDNPIVKQASQSSMFLGEHLLMLYPDETDGHFIVIDHQRPAVPLSLTNVIVLETEDMVNVRVMMFG